jgi:CBS domain containing-hemolysin-like protein
LDDPDQTWLLAANWIPAEGGGWNNAIIVAWLVAFLAAICRAALQDYSRNRLMESLEGTRRQRRFSRYLEREELIEAALTLVLVVAEIWFVWAIPGLLAFGAEQAVFGEPHSLERRSWGFLFGLLVLLPTVHALPGAVAGRGNGEAVLRATLPISYWLSLLLVPLVYPLLLLPAGSRLFHKKPVDRETEKDLVTDEIIDAVEEGERAGALEGQEAQMIERVLSLQERSVSEVMTPRTDLTSISIQSSVIEACRMAHEEGHSKIPVYKKNRDEIAGIFHLRDAIPFLSNGKSPPPLEKLLREAYFVPETKKVTQLLREFQSEEQSLAIILDEYGGTAGVITVSYARSTTGKTPRRSSALTRTSPPSTRGCASRRSTRNSASSYRKARTTTRWEASSSPTSIGFPRSMRSSTTTTWNSAS